MNKKVNTLLFVLGATLVNMFLMVGLFLALFAVYGIFAAARVSPAIHTGVIIVLFTASILGTYFLYHKLVALMSRKMDFEKYFHPIFRSKKK